MAVLDIVTYPDPRLREPTVEVEPCLIATQEFVRDLIETMYAHRAVGIAAPQVGRPWRLFVLDGRHVGAGDTPLVLVNPALVATGGGLAVAEEGCLSFPGVFVDVRRPRWARVNAFDTQRHPVSLQGDGLLGRAIQHELDHLNGRLMLDLVGAHKRKMIERRMRG